ncbi:MAG TPA: carboxypeptidase regulatory-like domain-containing protein [Gemmatimonadaceae bacterium]|nr:carboxypeptidase regulatory-like domain-containing protein [Gemmatimonadaceae bacterium]
MFGRTCQPTVCHIWRITVFLAASLSSPGNAQQREVGWVLDASTRVPLSAATVSILNSPISVCSGLSGYFALPALRPGNHYFRVVRVGYAPRIQLVTIGISPSGIGDVELAPTVVATEGDPRIAVTASPRGENVVAALFRGLEPAPDTGVINKARTIASEALARQKAADRSSPDYLGILNDISAARDSQVMALLPTDALRHAMRSNIERNPEADCPR